MTCEASRRKDRPNIVFLLADQLRAASLPLFGENQIETPHIDRLADEGGSFTNAVSTCAVCSPYRSMLLTGRHPQTTGHIINSVRSRHDEISIGDVFSHHGYQTGWIGKWHLHTGSYPQTSFPIGGGVDYVPRGRDRLGFEYWRGYNFHTKYTDGFVNIDDWSYEVWDGYETNALNSYAFDFMNSVQDDPFCLFISPHQPHFTPHPFAPQKYYDMLPAELSLPDNVPMEVMKDSLEQYRHYLAMILAIDDMVGELREFLAGTGRLDNTLFVFTSDHGSQFGAQGIRNWRKLCPYEESLHVPLLMHWPGHIEKSSKNDTLIAPVDILPTLCGLCGLPVPRTVEGLDLSAACLGRDDAREQDAALTMRFSKDLNGLEDGMEWRGVRTPNHSYARYLNGEELLFDLEKDPLQQNNLAEENPAGELLQRMRAELKSLLDARNDSFPPASEYTGWFDQQRRIVRNAYGPLSHPEGEPDWSLLT